MTKVQLENLVRAKLYCSYVYLQEGKYKEVYISYKEAWGMYEVLRTFFPSANCFSFYYYTCRSAYMQQNDYEKLKKVIEVFDINLIDKGLNVW